MSFCGSCGTSGCAGGCGRAIIANCGSNCNQSSKCGKGNGCCGGGCNTSVSILSNTVNPRDCCPADKAHLYAYNVSTILIGANGNVSFDHVGVSNRIIPPGAAGNDATQIRIVAAGTYQYNFLVRAVGQIAGVPQTAPLVFQITVNGQPVQGSQYTSQDHVICPAPCSPTVPGNRIAIGFGLITVPANTVIQLNNITGAFASDILLTSFPTGGPPGADLAVNASIRLIKTC